MYGYIYRITDLTNGKCYIGQHKYDKPMLDPYYHGSSRILKKRIAKHPDNFLEELLMICATLDELNYFETYFIEHMNTLHPNGYNLNLGGNGNKAHSVSKKTRQKISKKLLGRTQSEESNRKRSHTLKGHEPWNKGKHHSEETKKKIGEQSKGREPWNKGLKGYNSGNKNGMYGKHHTEEYKKQKSISFKGKNNPRYIIICPLLLFKYYVLDKMTQLQIATLFNVNQPTISRKLKEYSISNKNYE